MAINMTLSEFDWEYYLKENQDLVSAGFTTQSQAYRHWSNHGCRENRLIRRLGEDTGYRVNLRYPHQVKAHVARPSSLPSPTTPTPIKLTTNIAIMIHLYDLNQVSFFIRHLSNLSQRYILSNFFVFLSVVTERNPSLTQMSLTELTVVDYLTGQLNKVGFSGDRLQIIKQENRGGDIGSLFRLSRQIATSPTEFSHVLFCHSKANNSWRKELCLPLFNFRFETLAVDTAPVGLYGAQKWVHTFDHSTYPNSTHRHLHYLTELSQIYGIPSDLVMKNKFQFIAGTMFIAHIEIIKTLATGYNLIYPRLNNFSTIDHYWLNLVTNELHRNPRGCGNDLAFRMTFGRSLHGDHMIEHGIERLMGLIAVHLGMTLSGV
jgi:hypothetical protein